MGEVTKNLFLEAQGLLSKVHKTVSHCSCNEKRCEEPCSHESNMPSGLVSTNEKLDLKERQASARCNLVHSILRLREGHTCCFVGKMVIGRSSQMIS